MVIDIKCLFLEEILLLIISIYKDFDVYRLVMSVRILCVSNL